MLNYAFSYAMHLFYNAFMLYLFMIWFYIIYEYVIHGVVFLNIKIHGHIFGSLIMRYSIWSCYQEASDYWKFTKDNKYLTPTSSFYFNYFKPLLKRLVWAFRKGTDSVGGTRFKEARALNLRFKWREECKLVFSFSSL